MSVWSIALTLFLVANVRILKVSGALITGLGCSERFAACREPSYSVNPPLLSLNGGFESHRARHSRGSFIPSHKLPYSFCKAVRLWSVSPGKFISFRNDSVITNTPPE